MYNYEVKLLLPIWKIGLSWHHHREIVGHKHCILYDTQYSVTFTNGSATLVR